jgi:hypothetical protein
MLIEATCFISRMSYYNEQNKYIIIIIPINSIMNGLYIIVYLDLLSDICSSENRGGKQN